MKKLIALLLSIAMLVCISACGSNDNGAESGSSDVVTENSQSEVSDETSVENTTDESSDDQTSVEESSDAAQSGDTAGQTLYKAFQDTVNSDPSLSAQQIADAVMANEIIQFGPMSMPIEPGLLSGFGNAEITGFDEGVMFGPAIGTIPFIGYVFTLSEGTDVDTFVKTLEDNADLRWNICTEAEEMVAGNVGNTVFFVMCLEDLNAQQHYTKNYVLCNLGYQILVLT